MKCRQNRRFYTADDRIHYRDEKTPKSSGKYREFIVGNSIPKVIFYCADFRRPWERDRADGALGGRKLRPRPKFPPYIYTCDSLHNTDYRTLFRNPASPTRLQPQGFSDLVDNLRNFIVYASFMHDPGDAYCRKGFRVFVREIIEVERMQTMNIIHPPDPENVCGVARKGLVAIVFETVENVRKAAYPRILERSSIGAGQRENRT